MSHFRARDEANDRGGPKSTLVRTCISRDSLATGRRRKKSPDRPPRQHRRDAVRGHRDGLGWVRAPYLIEARSIGGLSGLPVFFDFGPVRGVLPGASATDTSAREVHAWPYPPDITTTADHRGIRPMGRGRIPSTAASRCSCRRTKFAGLWNCRSFGTCVKQWAPRNGGGDRHRELGLAPRALRPISPARRAG